MKYNLFIFQILWQSIILGNQLDITHSLATLIGFDWLLHLELLVLPGLDLMGYLKHYLSIQWG